MDWQYEVVIGNERLREINKERVRNGVRERERQRERERCENQILKSFRPGWDSNLRSL